jgi:hypothetical protein
MEVKREIVHRLTFVNDCGCQSIREYKDQMCKEPMGGSKFTACDIHKAKSQDVQEILEMMTNQALDREASSTPAPPVQHVSGPDARFPLLGNVVVTEGSSTVVATGGGKATTMHMPNMPKRNPEDILNPRTVSRTVVTTSRKSSKTAAPAALDMHDEDAALFAGAGSDAQMDEVEEHEGLTALLDNGGLGSLEDDPDRSTSS